MTVLSKDPSLLATAGAPIGEVIGDGPWQALGSTKKSESGESPKRIDVGRRGDGEFSLMLGEGA